MVFRRQRPEEEVKALIERFEWADRNESESEFKVRLRDYLYKTGGFSPKAEAGVQGLGARVDLYFQVRTLDVILSIKKDMNEQSAKVLLGEALVLANSWQASPPADRVHLFVVPFGKMGSAEVALLEPLCLGLVSLARVNQSFAAEVAVPGAAMGEPAERPGGGSK